MATGPLTNIALAVRREPRLTGWVHDFRHHGRLNCPGQHHAGRRVQHLGRPGGGRHRVRGQPQVTMVGLDVTLQARATPAVQDRLRSLGRLAADLLLPGLLGYQGEASTGDPATSGPAVHDVLAVALVAEPGLFGCDPARVEVETAGRWTSGMTVTDFAPQEYAYNALVARSKNSHERRVHRRRADEGDQPRGCV